MSLIKLDHWKRRPFNEDFSQISNMSYCKYEQYAEKTENFSFSFNYLSYFFKVISKYGRNNMF